MWRARSPAEAARWVEAISQLIHKLNKQRKKQKQKVKIPTAAPSELVVRKRTGKSSAPHQNRSSAVSKSGVELRRVEQIDGKIFLFHCTDEILGNKWVVERRYSSIEQLYRTLVDTGFINGKVHAKPAVTTNSIKCFLQDLLISCCNIVHVFLSDLQAATKEEDKARVWNISLYTGLKICF